MNELFLAITVGDLALPLFLVVVGLLAIFLEVYIPSAGVIGITSAGLMLTGVFIAWRTGDEKGAPWLGWVFLLAVIVFVPIAVVVAFRTLPYTPMGRRLLLDGAPKTDEQRAGVTDLSRLTGTRGSALTDLRPYGTGEIGGERHEVSTEGNFIDRGTAIVVHRVEGNRIFVRPDPDASNSTS